MTKEDVAAALEEIGTLLELKGEPSFRTMSYHTAARALLEFEGDFQSLVAAGPSHRDPRHRRGDARKIDTLVKTGELPQLTALRAEVPPGIVQMLRLPGLGPKKVKALYDQLKIDTLDELKAACEAGESPSSRGSAARRRQKILEGHRFLEQGRQARPDRPGAAARR